MIDVISELFINGIIVDCQGRVVREGERIKHDKYGMGSYVLVYEKDAGTCEGY